MPAGQLNVGDRIRSVDGGYGFVKEVQLVVQAAALYNLTVSDAHTFFVGEEGWLVHNACPIYGTAQVTADPTHASRIQTEAARLSEQKGVVEVHLNRTLNSATGGAVKTVCVLT